MDLNNSYNKLFYFFLIIFIISKIVFCQEALIDIGARGVTWNSKPENPDGSKIAYIKFYPDEFNQIKNPDTGKLPPYWQNAKLMICDAEDYSNKIEIGEVKANAHAGAMLFWISNDKLICRSNDDGISVWDINNPGKPDTVYRKQDYNIENALWIMDYDENNNLIITGQDRYRDENNKIAKIMTLDPYTGDTTIVVDANTFLPWKDKMDFSDDPKDWILNLHYFNPSGNMIFSILKIRDPENGSRFKIYGFSYNLQGKDIVFMGRVDGHPDWWDDETIFSSDDGRIYNRDGSYTGLQVSGDIAHSALSEDRNFIAGESHCPAVPVELYLFEKFKSIPVDTIFSTPNVNVTWGYYGCVESHDLAFHVDPSFSRTRKRIYYNRAYDYNSVGYYAYDFSNIVNHLNNESPGKFYLYNNYPNPFNSYTNIRYSLVTDSKVLLKIYDINGKEIKTLVNNNFYAGDYSVTFNAENLPSGVYFYRLVTEFGRDETRKMLFLK